MYLYTQFQPQPPILQSVCVHVHAFFMRDSKPHTAVYWVQWHCQKGKTLLQVFITNYRKAEISRTIIMAEADWDTVTYLRKKAPAAKEARSSKVSSKVPGTVINIKLFFFGKEKKKEKKGSVYNHTLPSSHTHVVVSETRGLDTATRPMAMISPTRATSENSSATREKKKKKKKIWIWTRHVRKWKQNCTTNYLT